MGELGQELGLLVVLEVDVVLGQVNLQACVRGSSANLGLKKRQMLRILSTLLADMVRTRFPWGC